MVQVQNDVLLKKQIDQRRHFDHSPSTTQRRVPKHQSTSKTRSVFCNGPTRPPFEPTRNQIHFGTVNSRRDRIRCGQTRVHHRLRSHLPRPIGPSVPPTHDFKPLPFGLRISPNLHLIFIIKLLPFGS